MSRYRLSGLREGKSPVVIVTAKGAAHHRRTPSSWSGPRDTGVRRSAGRTHNSFRCTDERILTESTHHLGVRSWGTSESEQFVL